MNCAAWAASDINKTGYDATIRDIPYIQSQLTCLSKTHMKILAYVITGVPNRVHRMRCHFENTIEGQILVNQEKEVSPV